MVVDDVSQPIRLLLGIQPLLAHRQDVLVGEGIWIALRSINLEPALLFCSLFADVSRRDHLGIADALGFQVIQEITGGRAASTPFKVGLHGLWIGFLPEIDQVLVKFAGYLMHSHADIYGNGAPGGNRNLPPAFEAQGPKAIGGGDMAEGGVLETQPRGGPHSLAGRPGPRPVHPP